MSHWFACEIEEVLKSAGNRRTRLHRIDRGFAFADGDETSGFDIRASSEPFDRECRLLEGDVSRRNPAVSPQLPDGISSRTLTRFAATSDGVVRRLSHIDTMTIHSQGLTMVTTPDNATLDAEFLLSLTARTQLSELEAVSGPITWSRGSAAVLLHEAIGHPAERGVLASDWPDWLEVEDSPSSGELVSFESDDIAHLISTANLSRNRPEAFRRWSHRDVPMRRLTNLVVRGSGTPLPELPEPRVDVLFVSHGTWDPELDVITVRIDAADFVRGGKREPLAPFVFRAGRLDLADRLRGWFGELMRHPGVLCSEEGVQLPVGSAAVGLLTEAE